MYMKGSDMNVLRNLTAASFVCLLSVGAVADEARLISSFDQLLALLEDDSVTHQTQRDGQIVHLRHVERTTVKDFVF